MLSSVPTSDQQLAHGPAWHRLAPLPRVCIALHMTVWSGSVLGTECLGFRLSVLPPGDGVLGAERGRGRLRVDVYPFTSSLWGVDCICLVGLLILGSKGAIQGCFRTGV